MLEFLQANLAHCSAGLFLHSAAERSADAVLVSKQYRNIGPINWMRGTQFRAAIYVRGGTVQEFGESGEEVCLSTHPCHPDMHMLLLP